MHLSVVIATKDRSRALARALRSLELQRSAPVFEVVVVDNGSTDATPAIVEAQANRGVYPIAYEYEAQPNRGKARNRGIQTANGGLIVFCDDDVQAPRHWLAAHARAHRGRPRTVVNGPILNVPSYDDRPKPTPANYSGAFLCTCNASVPRAALREVGGFDERFDLYGWEDTELGVRLRDAGVRHRFAWDAAIWHVKLPGENSLDVEARKTVERARMAHRFVAKHPTKRARAATGMHAFNLWRARWTPDVLLPAYAGAASWERLPGWIRAVARGRFLDQLYVRELLNSRPADDER
ncbi:MAG TPA: glycosyltransferase [Candidatus Tumulicola sp.]